MKKLYVLLWLVCALSICRPILAADFSKAQHVYVPPSLIHRDLDSLGPNKWNLPAAATAAAGSAGTVPASVNPIDSLLSNFGGGAATSGAGTAASVGAGSALSNWGNTVLTGAQYIPGVNKIAAQVNTLMSNGQVAEAENLTRAGLKYFPASSVLKGKFTTITSAEAQTFCASGNYDLAGKKAREALACNPNAKTAKIVEGKVLQTQGLNPSTAEGHVQAGESLSTDGRLLEAGVEYKLALNIKPTAAAHVGLGNLALGKGSVVDAGRHYEQAIALDPRSAAAYRQRGALRYVMRDSVGANSDFSKAVSLAPDDHLSSDALVGLWKQQASINPGVNSHLGLARAYMQTNNLEAAKSEYKTVASLDPNNPALPEARRSFKMALAKQQAGQNVQAAKTLEGQGALGDAQQKLNEALTLSPDDPQILLYHGQISEKLGMYGQAHESYMSALKADPKNVDAANKLKALGQQQNFSMPALSPNYQNLPQQPIAFPNYHAPQPAPIPNTTIQVNPNNPINNPATPDIFSVPLKSPLPPKSEILPTDYSGDQNFSVIDSSDEVSNLANFFCSVRALMLAEKQGLQLSSAGNLK